MLKHSILVPTRGRPDNVLRLIRSICKSAVHPERVEVLFYLDSDDPELESYQQLFSTRVARFQKQLARCDLFIGEPMSVSKSWNIIAGQCQGDTLLMGNDDQVFVTPGWDVRIDEEQAKFPDKIYCMWFEDGINGARHCAFPILSRTWYETLGYFTPGIFKFLCNDTWTFEIAKKVNRTHFIPDVLVEHRHFSVDKSERDETYMRHRQGGAQSNVQQDLLLFHQAEPTREREAAKLREVIAAFSQAVAS